MVSLFCGQEHKGLLKICDISLIEMRWFQISKSIYELSNITDE